MCIRDRVIIWYNKKLIGGIMMLIQEKEIRRIVQNEKEYRYGRFMDMKEYLERMTISYDENNHC